MFNISIPGRPIVKKNTMRSFGRRQVYTPLFKAWETQALLLLKSKWKKKPIECTIFVQYLFFFKNKQAEADVSNLIEGPQDALTKAGVIVDDKLVVSLSAHKYFYAEPRTEITIYEIEED